METNWLIEASAHLVELDRTFAIREKQGKQPARFSRSGRTLAQSAVVAFFDGNLEVLPSLLLTHHAHGHAIHGMQVVLKMNIKSS